MRIVFAGTPDFAVPALQSLIDSPFEVVAVYTQPDRPAGRGRHLQQSPVKELAVVHHLAVRQPENLRGEDELQALRALEPDLMIVIAFGMILPKRILEIPRLGCINVHASLLPRFRGAAPIQRAIMAGDTTTGVCIMQMDVGLDTGPVILRAECPILPDETGGTLHDKLSLLGADALMRAMMLIEQDTVLLEHQDSAHATTAAKIKKEEGQLLWTQDAPSLEKQIRAFNPWPIAYTHLESQTLRIHSAEISGSSTEKHAPPGTIINLSDEGIDVACGQGVLRILTLQLPGKKVMTSAECVRGHGKLFKLGACLI